MDVDIEQSLAAMQRVVAISRFFPPSHPLVSQALRHGYDAYQPLEAEHRIRASGLQVADGEVRFGDREVGRDNPLVGHLARILYSHGVIRVRPADTLGPAGYAGWVNLLTEAPEALEPHGGLRAAWSRSGHGEALELQCETSLQPRHRADGRGGEAWDVGWSPQQAAAVLSDPALFSPLKDLRDKGPREQQLLEWLFALGWQENDADFDRVLGRIAGVVREYLEHEWHWPAYQVVIFFVREAQAMEAMEQVYRHDRLMGAMRGLVDDGLLQWILQTTVEARLDLEARVGQQVLAMLGKPSIIRMINALVAEQDRAGRSRLVEALVCVGEPVVPYAVKMLGDRRWYVVRNMAAVLGGVGSARALEPLRALCDDDDPRVRCEVVRALGKISGPQAQAAVAPLLDHDDASMRRAAVDALAAQRTEEALELLWNKFDRISMGSDDWELRVDIVEALGKMGLELAGERLCGVIDKKSLRQRSRWERLRVACVLALGELGGELAVNKLSELEAHANPDLRRAAEGALAALGRPG